MVVVTKDIEKHHCGLVIKALDSHLHYPGLNSAKTCLSQWCTRNGAWPNLFQCSKTSHIQVARSQKYSKVKYTDIAVHSLTCHTATETHMPDRIIQCYLPPDRNDIPAFTPAEAGT